MEQNYRLMYAQKAIEAMEYETALDDAIAMLVPDLVSSQDKDFKDVCRDVKQSLLKNARTTMRTVLKEIIVEKEQGEEYERQ